MFEKVSQMAERMATSVSRRRFLGRFGGAALAAAAMGGILALPGGARASNRCARDFDCPKGKICVGGLCVKGSRRLCDVGTTSSLSCQGANVGDGCVEGNFVGYCGPLTGTGTACSCRSW